MSKEELFIQAVIEGNLDRFIEIENSLPEDEEIMYRSFMFYCGKYSLAAENGHLHIMKHIEAEAPNEVQDMIENGDDYDPYRLAAENGHLHVLEHLEEKMPDIIQKMSQVNDYSAPIIYRAYRNAAPRGHLHVMVHLDEKAYNEIQILIQEDAYDAYVVAAEYNQIIVCAYILAIANDQNKANMLSLNVPHQSIILSYYNKVLSLSGENQNKIKSCFDNLQELTARQFMTLDAAIEVLQARENLKKFACVEKGITVPGSIIPDIFNPIIEFLGGSDKSLTILENMKSQEGSFASRYKASNPAKVEPTK